MQDGRLIRVGGYRGDIKAIVYVVAVSNPSKAKDLVKAKVAGPADESQNLGLVSAALLIALELPPGQFIRADGESEGGS